jgi:hypothetical protein
MDVWMEHESSFAVSCDDERIAARGDFSLVDPFDSGPIGAMVRRE